jgi:DNA-binding transcriptional regulator WhiA
MNCNNLFEKNSRIKVVILKRKKSIVKKTCVYVVYVENNKQNINYDIDLIFHTVFFEAPCFQLL